MGSIDMGELKQSFVKLVRQVTAPQMPQFMIWLDVKLAEYKLNGYMRLGIFMLFLCIHASNADWSSKNVY